MPVGFEISDPEVVKIDRNPNEGWENQITITAKKPGTATITPIFDDNGKEIRESITV